MSPLADCCIRCPHCGWRACSENGQVCPHDEPVCLDCCQGAAVVGHDRDEAAS